ncbi:BtrH N-terminal domain-containing protein [Roseateles sp. BYS180W]|uniref:BtrH N-terminal domain-containing protein n=1 Tax=Roseateles rivi TaxID=3299028 RepID=A0ABW7FU04_9BURK
MNAPALQLQHFTPLPGVHCESSTLRMMLAHAGLPLSEAMVFGLGQGLDFVIWPCDDPAHQLPILSGRIDSCGLIEHFARHSGVALQQTQTDDPADAQAQLEQALQLQRVAGVKLDIYHLPYFSAQRHFCAHFLAVVGLQGEVAQVVDTASQGGAQTLALPALQAARASMKGLQASRHLLVQVPAPAQLDKPLPQALRAAIAGCAENYLQPPDSTRGWRGLQTLLARMPHWWRLFADPPQMLMGIANFWEFAGTGGANFRLLYAQFLQQCLAHLDSPALPSLVARAHLVAQGWSECIAGLRSVAQQGDGAQLEPLVQHFALTVAQEHQLMQGLARIMAE